MNQWCQLGSGDPIRSARESVMVTIALNVAGVRALGNSAGTFSSRDNASSLASDDRRETCDLVVPLSVPKAAAQMASKATW